MVQIAQSRTEWLAVLLQSIRDSVSISLDLDDPGSIEAALAFAVANVDSIVSQRAQLAVDSASTETARGGALNSITSGNGVERLPATSSRYTTQVVDTGPITLVGGEVVQGGGADGKALWTIITTGTVSSGDPVIIEASDPGPTTLTSPATLTTVTTVPGLTELSWTSGVDPDGQIGRFAESDASLVVRNDQGGAGLGPELLALSWVVAATVETTGSGRVQVTVAPGPVGPDQIAELVEVIGSNTTGIETSDATAASGTYTQPGGLTRPVWWDVGSTVSPSVAITVVQDSDSTATVAQVQADVDTLIRGYYETLVTGDDIIRQQVIASALDSTDVEDVTACLIDGAATNYTVAPTDIATPPATITVTVT